MMEPRKVSRRGQQDAPQRYRGAQADGVHAPEGTHSAARQRRVRRTPPGSESGRCPQRENAETSEHPRISVPKARMGARAPTGPGLPWGFHPATSPRRHGGVMAPVLAKICLHQVLDAWCAQAVQPRMPGRGVLMRFAEACVMGCEAAAAARRSMDVLPQRCARSGRTTHPT